MSMLLPGENLVHLFFAEVRQPARVSQTMLFTIPRASGLLLQLPDTEAFTSQVLLTTARLIFFQPSSKDIEALLLRKEPLQEVVYQAFYVANIERFYALADGQVKLSLVAPMRIALSIPRQNSYRIVTQFLQQMLSSSEQRACASWNFCFTHAAALLGYKQLLGYPQSVQEKPKFGRLQSQWSTYFDCYQGAQFVDRDEKQIESLVNSQISSDAFEKAAVKGAPLRCFGGDVQFTLKTLFPCDFLLQLKKLAAPTTISMANASYQLCESYSAIFVTPNIALSRPQFYQDARFPITAFGTVMRCGQVINGNSEVNAQFKQTLALRKREKLIVIEVGRANMTFGQVALTTDQPIEQLRLAYQAMSSQCTLSDAALSALSFVEKQEGKSVDAMTTHQLMLKGERDELGLLRMQNTHWLQAVAKLIGDGRALALAAGDQKALVLVVGDQERQYGSVLICLAEVMLSSDARTARGLSRCIRKHLEHAGFVFSLELFVLLIDAISHLVQVQQHCFAYSDAFLARYLLLTTSGQYGNFLLANECERAAAGIPLTTVLLDAQLASDFDGRLEDLDFDSVTGFVNQSRFWREFQ